MVDVSSTPMSANLEFDSNKLEGFSKLVFVCVKEFELCMNKIVEKRLLVFFLCMYLKRTPVLKAVFYMGVH